MVGQSYFVDEPSALDGLSQFAVERDDFVPVVAQVEDSGPVEAFGGEVQRAQLQFHALVVQLPHVGQVAGETRGGADGHVVEQVLRVAVVILQRDKDAVDERKVQPDVQVVVLLPFQVRVGL